MKFSLFIMFIVINTVIYGQCSFNFNSFPPSCALQCDGIIDVTATGTSPYTATINGTNMNAGGSAGIDFSENSLCAGDYIIEITDATNCTYIDTVTVDPWPPIQINVAVVQAPSSSIACDGQISCQFFDQFFTGSTVGDWYNCDDSTVVNPSSSGDIYSGFCSGNYYVEILGPFGCPRAYSECISLSSTSAIENIETEFDLVIKNNAINLPINTSEAFIYTILGKKVLSTSMNNISIEFLKTGIYLVQIKTKEGRYYSTKFVKN